MVIPTLNEHDNVRPLLQMLTRALDGIAWEAIFVDDNSKDGTADLIREIAREAPHVRVLQRIGRRGLTSACQEGMLATAAPYVAVMDADLQHDETLLPRMLELMRTGNYDVVVASRNTGDGSMGDFSAGRVRLSNAGKWLARAVTRTDLSDPMSGFFMADRRFVQSVAGKMSGISFKVLVDLVSSSGRPVRFADVPYRFRERLHGESKLDPHTLMEFGILIVHKLIRGVLPVRFVLFSVVGTLGMMLHLAVLALLLDRTRPFAEAQAAATVAAMASNFWLNNQFTFRDRRLKGVARIAKGAVTFFVCCSLGGVASLALGEWLLRSVPWYLAGLAGTAIAAVWNFGVASTFTWPERR